MELRVFGNCLTSGVEASIDHHIGQVGEVWWPSPNISCSCVNSFACGKVQPGMVMHLSGLHSIFYFLPNSILLPYIAFLIKVKLVIGLKMVF